MPIAPICCICCENFTSNCVVKTTNCGHLFHENCIRRWLARNSSCPECRQFGPALNRVYLNFNESTTTEVSGTSLTPIVNDPTDHIQKLIMRLSLEEEKHKMSGMRFRENERKLREEAKITKERLRDQHRLLKEYKEKLIEMKKSLEESQKSLKEAEAARKIYKKELNSYKQIKQKRQAVGMIDVGNETERTNQNFTTNTQSYQRVICSLHSSSMSKGLTRNVGTTTSTATTQSEQRGPKLKPLSLHCNLIGRD